MLPMEWVFSKPLFHMIQLKNKENYTYLVDRMEETLTILYLY